MFIFIPNTPVLVTWGQKPMTGQLSDFINGLTGGKILNKHALYYIKILFHITGQDDVNVFMGI